MPPKEYTAGMVWYTYHCAHATTWFRKCRRGSFPGLVLSIEFHILNHSLGICAHDHGHAIIYPVHDHRCPAMMILIDMIRVVN